MEHKHGGISGNFKSNLLRIALLSVRDFHYSLYRRLPRRGMHIAGDVCVRGFCENSKPGDCDEVNSSDLYIRTHIEQQMK